jgi:predicted small secreted protein
MRRQTILLAAASLFLAAVVLAGCNNGAASGGEVKSEGTPRGASMAKPASAAPSGGGAPNAPKGMTPSTQ